MVNDKALFVRGQFALERLGTDVVHELEDLAGRIERMRSTGCAVHWRGIWTHMKAQVYITHSGPSTELTMGMMRLPALAGV